MKDVLKALVFGGLFAIPFLTLYVENNYFFPYITGKNFMFRIIVEVVFASWVLLALSDRDYRPKFSWIVPAFGSLLVVMFFADLFGEFPLKSFWSNFERMEGYVTLVHVFLYFITLGSVLTTARLWNYFLHASLIAAFFVTLYGLAQYAGLVDGRARIDSRLGNAAYMAIYMLFHTFIAFWLFVESRVTLHRVIYALLGATFIFTLLQTATRGTTIGLVVGIFVMAAYVGIFGARFKEFRKYAIGAFAVLVLAVGGFIAAKDTNFVQDNPVMRRIANISLEELQVRFTIWGMAWEGVKERPILGWGQGNFNYVFNTYYEPSLYAQEQWFDRVHNIFFDWLIAGGILGFIAYFSILFAALYYLFWQPLFSKAEPAFNVLERGVLIGLLAGYFTHNLVVFDNIISYIFYGTILALVHSRVATDIPKVMNWRIDERLVTQFAAPIILIVAGTTVYFVNFPGMRAAGDIIDAFQAGSALDRLKEFDQAIGRKSFGDQEVIEQLAQQAIGVANNQNIDEETRQAFIQRAELEILRMIQEKPGDARLHVFLASYYRAIGALPQAAEQAAIARALSPNKQSIIVQQGIFALGNNDPEGGRDFFKEAFDLNQRNNEARELYAASLFYLGQTEEAKALFETDAFLQQFALNDYSVNGVRQSGDFEFLAKIYEIRTEKRPEVPQNWASLAYIYYELERFDEAIEVLATAKEVVPEFANTAQCFSDNIAAGKQPDLGCL